MSTETDARARPCDVPGCAARGAWAYSGGVRLCGAHHAAQQAHNGRRGLAPAIATLATPTEQPSPWT
jgi:hypothetical protein